MSEPDIKEPNPEEELAAMRRETYFGLLLSTAAQVCGPVKTIREIIAVSEEIICLCADAAGINLDRIKP